MKADGQKNEESLLMISSRTWNVLVNIQTQVWNKRRKEINEQVEDGHMPSLVISQLTALHLDSVQDRIY